MPQPSDPTPGTPGKPSSDGNRTGTPSAAGSPAPHPGSTNDPSPAPSPPEGYETWLDLKLKAPEYDAGPFAVGHARAELDALRAELSGWRELGRVVLFQGETLEKRLAGTLSQSELSIRLFARRARELLGEGT